jgi:HEAT repeat protein
MKRALLALLLLLACESGKEEKRALAQLSSRNAKERAEAVKALASRAADGDVFAALAKKVEDGAPAVRIEAAAALLASRRADAPDAVAPLLRDPDDSVRIAAVRALGSHCDDRARAYLRLAFAHGGGAVRAEVVQALLACGTRLEEVLGKEESERRRKALAQIGAGNAAQRAHGARELGLLGRDEDAKALLPLLEEKDGVVVAAAARALGDAGVTAAAAKIAALLKEQGEVAAAAAEALLALRAQATAREALERLAKTDGEEAVAAAAALAADGRACAVALEAARPRAAAMLAKDCDSASFAVRLEKGGHREALLSALMASRGRAPQLERPLSTLLRGGDRDVRLPQLALRHRVAAAALVEALRTEQTARARQIAARPREPYQGSAAEIAQASGSPDKEKYDRLMARLKERSGGEASKAGAAARLSELLQGGHADRRDFIAAALRAALALRARGADKLAASFAQDPDPVIAAAARGETESPVSPPSAPPLADPRIAIWSEDGAARVQACSRAGPDLESARRTLAAFDPERRVRLACTAPEETAPRK